MKEIEWDDFMENYDKYIDILRRIGEVWLLTHEGKKN